MGQHRKQHMVVPADIFPHFIVRHQAPFFPFLKTLFNRPADATQPDQDAKGGTSWGITDRVGIDWFEIKVRLITAQTGRSGGPSLHRVTH